VGSVRTRRSHLTRSRRALCRNMWRLRTRQETNFIACWATHPFVWASWAGLWPKALCKGRLWAVVACTLYSASALADTGVREIVTRSHSYCSAVVRAPSLSVRS
jgi:hypothetical protein